MPIAREVKIRSDWIAGIVRAKPSAVPMKGAVQGVARTVAKTPEENDPR